MTAERVLMALLLGGIAVGCVLVLYPFFSSLLWAAILVFTTWPVCEWLHTHVRLRRGPAAGVMVALTAVVLVLPLALAAPGGASDVNNLRGVIEDALRAGLPGSPHWVFEIPLVGGLLGDLWNRWAADITVMIEALRPYFGIVLEGGLGLLLGLANGVLLFVLALFIAFFFYLYGEPIAARLRVILQRIAGARADRLIDVTGATVRGVVYGILLTAIVQGILTAFGLWLSGVPRPVLLGAVAGFLAVLPIGAPRGMDSRRAVADEHRPSGLGHLPGGLWRGRGIGRRFGDPPLVHRTRRAASVPADGAGRAGRRARVRPAGYFPGTGAVGNRLYAGERMGRNRGQEFPGDGLLSACSPAYIRAQRPTDLSRRQAAAIAAAGLNWLEFPASPRPPRRQLAAGAAQPLGRPDLISSTLRKNAP